MRQAVPRDPFFSARKKGRANIRYCYFSLTASLQIESVSLGAGCQQFFLRKNASPVLACPREIET